MLVSQYDSLLVSYLVEKKNRDLCKLFLMEINDKMSSTPNEQKSNNHAMQAKSKKD